MKKTAKFIALILFITAAISIFAFSASAEGENLDTGTEDASVSEEDALPTDKESEDAEAALPDEGLQTPTGGEEGAEPSEENIFETVYRTLEANSDKIFSLLAFMTTLLVALAYKFGLLPLLRTGLEGFGAAITNISGAIAINDEENRGFLEKLDTAIEGVKGGSSEIALSIKKLEDELTFLRTNQETVLKIEKLFGTELEILYEVFMSSSLPQYQKDRIGESFSRMLTVIADEGKENEEDK